MICIYIYTHTIYMMISCFWLPLKAIRPKAPAHDQVCQRPLRPHRRRKALWVSTGHAPYTAAAACSSLSYASLALFQPTASGLGDVANGIGRSVILWYQEHPGTKCQASNCLDQMSPLEPSHGLLNKPPWSRLNKAASTSVIPWPGHAIDEFLHGHCEEKADCCLGSTAQHKNRGERSVKKCKDISDIKKNKRMWDHVVSHIKAMFGWFLRPIEFDRTQPAPSARVTKVAMPKTRPPFRKLRGRYNTAAPAKPFLEGCWKELEIAETMELGRLKPWDRILHVGNIRKWWWKQLGLGGWFQLVSTCFNLFQLVSTCFNLFQLVSTCFRCGNKIDKSQDHEHQVVLFSDSFFANLGWLGQGCHWTSMASILRFVAYQYLGQNHRILKGETPGELDNLKKPPMTSIYQNAQNGSSWSWPPGQCLIKSTKSVELQ